MYILLCYQHYFFLIKKISNSFLVSNLFNVVDSLHIHTFQRGTTFLQFFPLPFCTVPVGSAYRENIWE